MLARVGDQGDEGGVVRDSCYDSVLLFRCGLGEWRRVDSRHPRLRRGHS